MKAGRFFVLAVALATSFAATDVHNKHSTLQCNRTSQGDSCIVTSACWMSGTVQVFHKDADEPIASEEGFLPVPTRSCHNDGCKYIPFQHAFNHTWRSYGNDLLSRTTFVEHPLYITYIKPEHASFPHFLHDTILPLYETMMRVDGAIVESAQVMLLGPKTDFWATGVSRDLLSALSSGPVRHLDDVVSGDGRLCFSRAVIGVYTTVGVERFPNTSHPDFWARVKIFEGFRDHLLRAFGFYNIEMPRPTTPSVLIISRPWPRAILNEQELGAALKENGIQYHIADFAHLRIKEQIQLVRKHEVLVGMTGAGLLLSMFMQNPSVMIALYPYGTHPHRSLAQCRLGIEHLVFFYLSHVTRDAAGTPHLNGEYLMWENGMFEDTYAYWHQPRSLESHFFTGSRDWILSSKDCQALWAFHQNQDTVVDTKGLSTLIQGVVKKYQKIHKKKPAGKE